MARSSLKPQSPESNLKTSKSIIEKLPWPRQQNSSQAVWKPSALKVPPLAAIVLTSFALIVILQLLLVKSQKEGGIIIAETLNDIPFGQSFLYRYLPTIVALIYSIFWGWIDLSVKRLEPYHQLSKPGGAWGKDSLLLSYPFDFLPFIPLSALKRK